ncbi:MULTISPECIES: hypothetical protein [Virgibacillus]|uniref:Uncharacterized protein n=2 Tax=Virgibacillus TaxID=84406 RepID=A0A024QCU9_9BACI|nr:MULTISPECIES: hypothetical protein [Virgibacillus]EQB36305.1 hypothetical protein M948_14825 [Virgibacillus sp. CM-4]MYL42147.1 hypothetical protein [Virgibacillus massiliensis]GGJ45064.1 hypothetical protein GCM10007111_03860 [Virgibacillus kapii]CDQ40005.1 hypothetical protein BN990_02323 [Virgibacillus massiliensis]
MAKKILLSSGLLLGVLLLFQTSVFAEEAKLTNSHGINISDEEYEKLIDLGFSDLTIRTMEESEFNELIELDPESMSRDSKFFEVKDSSIETSNAFISSNLKPKVTELSKEEYFKRVKEQKNKVTTFDDEDSTSTSYRRLITQIEKYPSGIRLHSRFVWDIMPKTRSIDVLSTSIDDLYTPLPESEYGKQSWKTIHPIENVVDYGSANYSSSSSKWNRQGSGYGVKMNLKNSHAAEEVIELEGYAYFWIARSSSTRPNFINAYGNYSHQATSTETNFSYSLTYGAPSISWSGVSSTDITSITTHAQDDYY